MTLARLHVLVLTLLPQLVFANSISEKCVFPVAVHFGESQMVSTEENSDAYPTDVQLVDASAGSLGSISEKITPSTLGSLKGKSVSFSSSDKSVTVAIKVLTAEKQLGYWNSNVSLPEPEKSCAPSSDTTSSSVEVQVTRVQNKKSQSTKATLYCTSSGGYHGYWGQAGCPDMP